MLYSVPRWSLVVAAVAAFLHISDHCQDLYEHSWYTITFTGRKKVAAFLPDVKTWKWSAPCMSLGVSAEPSQCQAAPAGAQLHPAESERSDQFHKSTPEKLLGGPDHFFTPATIGVLFHPSTNLCPNHQTDILDCQFLFGSHIVTCSQNVYPLAQQDRGELALPPEPL